MKFEVEITMNNDYVKSFITKEYGKYEPYYKNINGLYQIGFIKEGKN